MKKDKLNVRMTGFEGPMDLLLHLIDKNEINIYDIPITELTDQYMGYIESHSMDSISEFILMAATLLEIKSKMLLPFPQKEEEACDPRQGLVEKLIEYKRFKQIADTLRSQNGVAKRVFRAPDTEVIDMLKAAFEKQPGEIVRELLADVSLDRLLEVFQSVIMRQELKVDKMRVGFSSVKREVFTVDDKISFIRNLLTLSREISFREIFEESGSRREIVVSFLAVLELVMRNEIRFRQETAFDDIWILRGRGEPA